MKAVLLAFLFMQVASLPVQTGIVTGQLRSSSGAPVAGIRVAAIAIPSPPQAPNSNTAASIATSDADGRYRLEKLPDGRYFIGAGPAQSLSYYPGVIPMPAGTVVTVTGGGTTPGIDFTPVLASATGVRVSGQLTNPIDVRLLNGTPRLSISGTNNAANVAADGTFTFEDIAAGTHTITLTVNTQPVASTQILVANSNINGVQLFVPKPVPLTGRVTVVDGGPLPRFSLTLNGSMGSYNPTLQTRPDGSFSLVVPEGEQSIGISNIPAGYLVKSMTYGSADLLAGPVTIPAVNPGQIVIALGANTPPPWVRVSGHITGSATGVRLSGDNLPGGLQANIATDGTFEFSKVLPGIYALTALHNSQIPNSMQVLVRNRDIADLEFVVPANIAISGRIVMEDGQPLQRPNFVFNGQRGRLNPMPIMSNDGTFTMAVPAGDYRLDITGIPPIYRLKSMQYGNDDLLKVPMKLDAAQPRELQLTIGLAQPSDTFRVRGQVRNFDNPSVAGRKVSLGMYYGSQSIQVPLGPQGTFAFDKVPPGTYVVRFEPAVTGDPRATITVVDKDITNVELSAPQLAVVHGQIVVDGGVPFSAFPVVFTGPAGSFGMDSPGGDQLHRFNATMPAGDYKLLFTASYAMCCGVTEMPLGYSVKSIVYDGKPLPEDRSISVRTSDAGKLVITVTATGVTVSGHLNGNVPAQTRVVLGGDRLNPVPGYSSDVRADGTFEFLKVVPGNYALRSNPDLPGVGIRTISVGNTDIRGLDLVVPRPVSVKGRVVLDDNISLPRFSLERGGSVTDYVRLSIEPDNNFAATLPEGESTIHISDLPVGYELRSLTYGATDLLKNPIKVDVANPQSLTIEIAPVGRWPKVSGRLLGIDTLPAIWRHIRMANFDAEPAPDGTFEFPRVPPGQYTVSVNASQNMATTTSVAITVVDRDIQGIELHAVANVQLTGRVIVEGGGPFPHFELVSRGASVPEKFSGGLQSNGNFYGSIPEAEYRLSVSQLTQGYSVKSMQGGGVDLLNNSWKVSQASAELVITFTVVTPPPWKRVSGRVVGDIPKVPPTGTPNSVSVVPTPGPAAAGLGSPYGVNGPERVVLGVLAISNNINNIAAITATINPDGTFTFDQVLPGTYNIRLTPVAVPLQPSILTVTGKDVSDVEVVITPNTPATR